MSPPCLRSTWNAGLWKTSEPDLFPFVKTSATVAPDFVADKICIRNCLDLDIAFSVCEGFRILKVTIGNGVKVSVVNEDTVMPLKLRGVPRSAGGDVDVATTTECGIVRISFRRWEESGGSSVEVGVVGTS